MMTMRMNKKLVVGLALALVLVSGAFVNANAQCATCLPNISLSTCMGNCNAVARPPLNASCQGAFHYGPTAPVPMGSVGGASGG
jgi:hypothetical protein